MLFWGLAAWAGLLVKRTRIDHRLGVAFAAQDDHQVRHHRRAAFVIKLDDIAKRRDLYALYGVLSGTMDQLISNASLMELNTADTAVR